MKAELNKYNIKWVGVDKVATVVLLFNLDVTPELGELGIPVRTILEDEGATTLTYNDIMLTEAQMMIDLWGADVQLEEMPDLKLKIKKVSQVKVEINKDPRSASLALTCQIVCFDGLVSTWLYDNLLCVVGVRIAPVAVQQQLFEEHKEPYPDGDIPEEEDSPASKVVDLKTGKPRKADTDLLTGLPLAQEPEVDGGVPF